MRLVKEQHGGDIGLAEATTFVKNQLKQKAIKDSGIRRKDMHTAADEEYLKKLRADPEKLENLKKTRAKN